MGLRCRGLSLTCYGLRGHRPQDANVLMLQLLEVMLQLVVPRVQHKHLERQRRRRDTEIGQRDDSGGSHGGGGKGGSGGSTTMADDGGLRSKNLGQ